MTTPDARKGKYSGHGLSVTVANGRLVIEIGIHVLAHAVSYAEWANPYDESRDDYVRTFAITDPEQFAKDVRHAMLHEEEDGSTPLSVFIDKASSDAVDDGSLGLDENFDHVIKHGEFSPLEIWAKEIP